MERFPVPISFELFPPKTLTGITHLIQVCRDLNQFNPEYFSVTFGACGANQDKSLATIQALIDEGFNVAPHLTCIGLSREHIHTLLKQYQAWGIKRLVALRGDLPADYQGTGGDFQYASELVEFIRDTTGSHFKIEVAAYPEFHPQAQNAHNDFACFKNKIAKGADAAITQYFYNLESYELFLHQCKTNNINVPIIPGIMPVINCEKLIRFSHMCGADVPMWLLKRLQCCTDEAAQQVLGVTIISRLCNQLIRAGAPALHFYTLNSLQPTASIIEAVNRQLAVYISSLRGSETIEAIQ